MNGDESVPGPAPAGRARGTRPSALHHLLYDRGVRFAAGLAVVVAIPVAVLFYFQFRALHGPRANVGSRAAAAQPGHGGLAGQDARGSAAASSHQRAAAGAAGTLGAAGSRMDRSRVRGGADREPLRRGVLGLVGDRHGARRSSGSSSTTTACAARRLATRAHGFAIGPGAGRSAAAAAPASSPTYRRAIVAFTADDRRTAEVRPGADAVRLGGPRPDDQLHRFRGGRRATCERRTSRRW